MRTKLFSFYIKYITLSAFKYINAIRPGLFLPTQAWGDGIPLPPENCSAWSDFNKNLHHVSTRIYCTHRQDFVQIGPVLSEILDKICLEWTLFEKTVLRFFM